MPPSSETQTNLPLNLLNLLNERRPGIDTWSFLQGAILLTALLLAITVRLLNFRYGFFLSEFDPYWHYRSADYIVENGIPAFISWIDLMSWVPGGRPVAASTPIGLPLFAASLYDALRFMGIGIDLMSLTILIPPLSGGLAVLAVYFLGTELLSTEVGLISAVLIAFNGSHIERTHLGFFKHETLGIPLIAISLLFFLKSVKAKDEKSTWAFSILAGLSLGYLAISWTGYVYAVGLIGLLTVVLSLLSLVDNSKLLLSFSVTQGIYLAIASLFPRSQAEILSLNLAVSFSAFAFIIAKRELDRLESVRLKVSAMLGIIAFGVFIGILGVQAGVLTSLYGKLLAILNPALRSEQAIIESVAEHKVSNWFTIFNDHGTLLLLFGFGLLLAIKKLDVNNVAVLLSGVTSLYFSTMMVRLGLIFSPFSCIIGSMGAYQLVSGAYQTIETRVFGKSRTRRRREGVSSTPLILSALLVFGLLAPAVYMGFAHAGTPVTIAAASLPIGIDIPDWPETLAWIRQNTPAGSVIMSWWDYGYWITTLGDRPTIIDNATINTTQVALVGKAFISNNTIALPIMRKFNVSYVVVFTSLPHAKNLGAWGDEVKWIWMAEIGYGLKTEPTHNYTIRTFGDYDLSKALADQQFIPTYSGTREPTIELPKRDYVLTRLLVLSSFGTSQSLIPVDPHFTLVYRSTYGVVSVFKVDYDYQGPTVYSLSASSSDITTAEWTWTTEYDFAPNRTVSFTVLNLVKTRGQYVVNGTEHYLNCSAVAELLTSDGSVVLSYDVELGENTVSVYKDRIVYTTGNVSKEVRFKYQKPLRISIRVNAEKMPEGVTGEVIEPAKAEMLIATLKIGWIGEP